MPIHTIKLIDHKTKSVKQKREKAEVYIGIQSIISVHFNTYKYAMNNCQIEW